MSQSPIVRIRLCCKCRCCSCFNLDKYVYTNRSHHWLDYIQQCCTNVHNIDY